MKEVGTTKSGDRVYEVPPMLSLVVERERVRRAKEAAAEEARRHQEAADIARSSARAAWAAVWISLAAFAVSAGALAWTAMRGG